MDEFNLLYRVECLEVALMQNLENLKSYFEIIKLQQHTLNAMLKRIQELEYRHELQRILHELVRNN